MTTRYALIVFGILRPPFSDIQEVYRDACMVIYSDTTKTLTEKNTENQRVKRLLVDILDNIRDTIVQRLEDEFEIASFENPSLMMHADKRKSVSKASGETPFHKTYAYKKQWLLNKEKQDVG